MAKDNINAAASLMGKKGGQTTKNKYGVDHFKKISQLAAIVNHEKALARKKAVK